MSRFAFLSSARGIRLLIPLTIAWPSGLALADEPAASPSAAPLPVTTAAAPPSDPQAQPSAPPAAVPPQTAPPAAPTPIATIPAQPTASPEDDEDEGEALPAELFDKKGRLKRKLRPIEGMRLPAEYREDTKSSTALWASGVGLLGGGYAVSAITAGFGYAFSDFCLFSSCSKDDEYLLGFIPLVGGFIASGYSEVPPTIKAFFMIGDIAQGAGLGLLIAGLAVREPVWVLKDEYRNQATVDVVVGPGSVGLSGTF